MIRSLLFASLLALPALAQSDAANAHLLAGAKAFRADQYEAALVEFKVAEKLGAGGRARWYVAASLQKLGRSDDALEAFLDAEAKAPEARDAVLTYYEAVASHQARLYLRADRLLASLGEKAGPKISGQAAELRRQLAPLLAAAPQPENVRWYLDRARALNAAGRGRVAALFAQEGGEVARRVPGCPQCAEAEQLTEPDGGEPRGAMPR